MVFATEKEMVEVIKGSDYIKKITCPGPCVIEDEVCGYFGIPDFVIVKKTHKKSVSFAFEAKLSNWNRALTQAFRYKAFVNKSYVIMDHDKVKPALLNTEKFSRSNIGLLSIENSGKVHIHYNPRQESPFSPQLEEKFNAEFKL